MHLLIIFLFFQIIRLSESTACYGGNVEELPMGCEVVIGYPLIIEGLSEEIRPDTELGKKLSTIRRVHNGIILRNNYFEAFNAMKNLQYIGIGKRKGPLLRFEQNHNLMSVEFPDLRIVNGSVPFVSFVNDYFPVQMSKSHIAFNMFLDIIATAGITMDPCDPGYFALHFEETESSDNWWFYVFAGSFGTLAISILVDLFCFTLFKHWRSRNIQSLKLKRDIDELNNVLVQEKIEENRRNDCEAIVRNENIQMKRFSTEIHEDPFYAPGELPRPKPNFDMKNNTRLESKTVEKVKKESAEKSVNIL